MFEKCQPDERVNVLIAKILKRFYHEPLLIKY